MTLAPVTGRGLLKASAWLLNREAPQMPSRWSAYKRLRLMSRLGPSTAVACGDEWLAVGGLALTLPGVAECWMRVSGRVQELGMGFRLARLCRRWLWSHVEGLHRVATCVPGTSDRWVAWAHSLGLRYEASLKAANSDGTDMLVFARIGSQISDLQSQMPGGPAWKD